MGAIPNNRIKFNKPNLKAIEKRINRGEFTKEAEKQANNQGLIEARRTYKSIGTELGINSVLVDELLSHAREGVDAHYVHPSMTRLQDASQRIADYMVNQAVLDRLYSNFLPLKISSFNYP